MAASVHSSARPGVARNVVSSSITTGFRSRTEVRPRLGIWSFDAALTTPMKRSDGSDLTWCERRRRLSLARAGRAICRPRPNCAPAHIGCFLDQSALPLAAASSATSACMHWSRNWTACSAGSTRRIKLTPAFRRLLTPLFLQFGGGTARRRQEGEAVLQDHYSQG